MDGTSRKFSRFLVFIWYSFITWTGGSSLNNERSLIMSTVDAADRSGAASDFKDSILTVSYS